MRLLRSSVVLNRGSFAANTVSSCRCGGLVVGCSRSLSGVGLIPGGLLILFGSNAGRPLSISSLGKFVKG